MLSKRAPHGSHHRLCLHELALERRSYFCLQTLQRIGLKAALLSQMIVVLEISALQRDNDSHAACDIACDLSLVLVSVQDRINDHWIDVWKIFH